MEEQRKSENALVPALRFEGFSDPWEQRKVGEILQIAFRAVDLEDDKKYQLVTVKRRNEGIVERARMAGRDILVRATKRSSQAISSFRNASSYTEAMAWFHLIYPDQSFQMST